MKNLLLLLIVSIAVLCSSCGKDDVLGCTNPNSDNYNSEATTDDGSCIISGCTDPESDNYNAEATVDDGSCIITGCTDPNASNYNPNATVEGDCIYAGCTDVQSDQYDETATEDDGSCETYFERWSGSYTGNFSCSGVLNQFLGEATMTFTKRDIPNNLDSMDVVLEFSLSEMPLSFSTMITRDSMYANAEFMEIDVDSTLLEGFPINIEKISLDINGVLGISEDNSAVQGVLDFNGIDLTSGFNTPLESSCEFTGQRQ